MRPGVVCTECLIAVIIAAAVTSAWRGAWYLLDALLLPAYPFWSATCSLLAGTVGHGLLMAVHPCLIRWAEHRGGRIIQVADACYSYLGVWVCVLVWRGVWLLWDEAFGIGASATTILNNHLALDGLVTHLVGALLLVIMGGVRNLVASPTCITSDACRPALGAYSYQHPSAFVFLGSRLRSCRRRKDDVTVMPKDDATVMSTPSTMTNIACD